MKNYLYVIYNGRDWFCKHKLFHSNISGSYKIGPYAVTNSLKDFIIKFASDVRQPVDVYFFKTNWIGNLKKEDGDYKNIDQLTLLDNYPDWVEELYE
jgi:hypothetical protein